jgi:hypothetical protein
MAEPSPGPRQISNILCTIINANLMQGAHPWLIQNTSPNSRKAQSPGAPKKEPPDLIPNLGEAARAT